jgi:hypothetical protein
MTTYDQTDDEPAETPSEIVAEAKKRFKQAEEAYSASRQRAIADTKFVMGDSDNMWQWPEGPLNARTGEKKVCLTVNITAQHCGQIINEIRKNRPTGRVLPSDNMAHSETANILGGLVRQIQTQSQADDAHDCAAEHAVYGGEGFWRLTTEYIDESSMQQRIRIRPCTNPQLVFIDPFCLEMDNSDANWGFVFEDITKEQCKREHPKIDPESWGPEAKKSGWTDKLTVRRAEYYRAIYTKDTAYLMLDGSSVLGSQMPAGAQEVLVEGVHYVKKRDTQVKTWKWCILLGGHDAPIDETDWAGKYLPIVSVVGKRVNVDGTIITKGQVADLKDPARMVNYAYSETVQTLALQNKIPYMAAAEAIEGHEAIWRAANIENRAYLPFNAFDDEGNALPTPQRQPPPVMPAAQIQLLQLSTEQLRAASGQQNSNFGIRSEASSGIGIERLKVQGENATFHFPDNLARGLRYEIILLLDLIPKIYDQDQIVTILGIDGKQEKAQIAHGLQGAYQETGQEDVAHIFNPNVGRYDVTIDTGPAYATQRAEAADRLADLAGRNPAVMQIAGDLVMAAQDFPMAEKLAERFAKTLPPQLQDKKQGEPDIPPEVAQKMQQLEQQMQHMGAALEEAHNQLQASKSGEQSKMAAAQMQAQSDQAAEQAKTQREMAALQAKQDRELQNAQTDAELAIKKMSIEAQTKIELARMEIEANEEIEEMKGYFMLQNTLMQPPSPGLAADVEGEFRPEASEVPLPKIITRKRIKMMAPSGAMYEGTIHDEPAGEGE